ncbi:hypothetical protein DRQ53_08350 [bacterium]|nr:MAG: hypothetical protein DRQ32_07530 [bacterium]RKZ15690.1 MAG: hypothetical protein DRQ53_08350 [bacterium]
MKRKRGVDRVRAGAVAILARWQRQHIHVEELVERHDASPGGGGGSWSPAERRRLRELVFSCVRLRARYDHIIESHSKRSTKLAPEVRAVFWVALHELVELDHPPHAVVDEAVRVVTGTGAGYARGFVNGLLRGVLRDGLRASFPDPADAVAYAMTWHSHPQWLVRRWVEQLGQEEAIALCAANNERPRLCLRTSPGARDAVVQLLTAMEWESEEVTFLPDGLWMKTRVPPALLLDQAGDRCTMQDAAAQLVAPLLAIDAPGLVLDLCAAPGGKASHLASLLPNSTVIAADLARSRLGRLLPTLERLGLGDRVACVVADARQAPFASGSFDAVLLDAPCTGTGVLSRRHDARWNRKPEDVQELAGLQRVLLSQALDLVRPGGVVLYSTCSLEPEENDEVVDFVLAAREDVREWPLDGCVRDEFLRRGRLATWPHRDHVDGAFAARLRKLEDQDR